MFLDMDIVCMRHKAQKKLMHKNIGKYIKLALKRSKHKKTLTGWPSQIACFMGKIVCFIVFIRHIHPTLIDDFQENIIIKCRRISLNLSSYKFFYFLLTIFFCH